MSDLNNNEKLFNLPTYLNIPLFLYQDSRLEKSATNLAAFFYSIHTAGQKITASVEYLCHLARVNVRQYYRIMNQLENLHYIRRSGHTNRTKIIWVYDPKSELIATNLNTTAPNVTSAQESNTTVTNDSKLVSSTTLNYCHPCHTDTKEDTKEYKKLPTVNPKPSSSSFFSEKQTIELLSYKIKSDSRSDEIFLENCQFHIEKQTNDLSKFQRFTGLKHILNKLNESQEGFKASGFQKESDAKQQDNRIPTQDDFNNYKRCINGYEWVGAWMQRQKSA